MHTQLLFLTLFTDLQFFKNNILQIVHFSIIS